ncbi:BnaCnng27300D [Brassica napus]|uniref:BnaCnng27300D protein n=1 Tax=Brassica napus TaxID=3708 RepID=A0A078IWY8_BRANA|nr:BnaCnng27300D [Brassica napus]
MPMFKGVEVVLHVKA